MTNQINIIEASTTEIIPQAVAKLVDRYNNFLAKTIENILELGKVVYEADQNLSGAERAIFCSQTNLKEGESTYRKLKQIGKNYETLLPHKSYLPNNWTTVYQLTRLNKDQFKSLVESQSLNPYSTMKEISEQINKKTDKVVKEDFVCFTITLRDKDKIKLFQLEQEIRDIATRLGLEYGYNKKQYEAMKESMPEFKQAA